MKLNQNKSWSMFIGEITLKIKRHIHYLIGDTEMCAYYVEYDYVNFWNHHILKWWFKGEKLWEQFSNEIVRSTIYVQFIFRCHSPFMRKMRKIDVRDIWPWITFFCRHTICGDFPHLICINVFEIYTNF